MSDVATFARREYLGDVVGLQNIFRGKLFGINPNSLSFPWLSQVADSWEMYQFKYMRFIYKGLVSGSTDSANQAELGSAIFTFVYDATEPSLQSKPQALNYSGAKTCLLNQTMTFDVDVPKTPLYVRPSGTIPIGEDIREYDFGYMQVSTQGGRAQAANQAAGEIWIEYQVSLWKAKIYDYLGGGSLTTTVRGPVPVGSTNYSVQPSQRQFLTDQLGSTSVFLPDSTVTNVPQQTFAIRVTQGQIILIEELWAGAANPTLPNATNIAVDTVTQIQDSIASAQEQTYFTAVTPGGLLTYTPREVGQDATAFRTTNNSCWLITRGGVLLMKTNVTSQAAAIAGQYYQITFKLLNRLADFNLLSIVDKPPLWQPNTI